MGNRRLFSSTLKNNFWRLKVKIKKKKSLERENLNYSALATEDSASSAGNLELERPFSIVLNRNRRPDHYTFPPTCHWIWAAPREER